MTERQKITKKLDKVLHDIVVLMYPACVTCGSTKDPTTGHYISRGNLSVKYDLMNLARQCSDCNSRHETDKEPFTNWFIAKYGTKNLAELIERSNQNIHSIKTWQLQEMYDQLLTIRKSLE